ncbi:unnamed protein product [Rotaria sordida]|uniref:RING-type domain-containing protein n=1 Tax=Rotaria sordida TaxID=392033 RepID=A0A815V788_9BILA|nr:unnamed protein product [Rotaria sordida]CAF1532160.1 unnamed protein product [Rotaria sordida]
MEGQAQSDSQGSEELCEVHITTDQRVLNHHSDSSQSLIDHEMSSINRITQEQQIIVNYGSCVMCNINERCVLFVGCNHLACCDQCSTTCNDTCPVRNCNKPIKERLHVFKP